MVQKIYEIDFNHSIVCMCGAVNYHTTLFPIHVVMPLVLRCVELPLFGNFPVIGSVGGVCRAGMGCGAALQEDLFFLERRPNRPIDIDILYVEVKVV